MKMHNKIISFCLRRQNIVAPLLCFMAMACIVVRVLLMPPLISGVNFGAAYYDRNGTLLRLSLANDDRYRIYTPLSQISKTVQDATILYEDRHFYRHMGVNPVALIRATISYIRPAKRDVGASTITMQVARMLYKINTKTPAGKLKQIVAAFCLDAVYSKDEILETYLNIAPYGGNIESIGAASLIYFGKSASDLSDIEAITLSTIPQNPTKRGLNTATGIANMSRMRGELARRWANEFPERAGAIKFADMPIAVRGIRDLPFLAPHFIDRQNSKRYKSEIRTTLDLELQTRLTRALAHQVARRKSIGVTNAAALLINYKTMEVLAHIGSVDYFDKSIYGENDGTHARRSPGSTLKPLIYAAAADAGFIHGMTLMKDAKINFGVYAPENSDNEFYGPVLARDALTHSRNIPAINLVRMLGVRNFYSLLTQTGVDGLRNPEHYGISIALGGAEVTMHHLATIYAAMANLGTVHEIRTDMNTPMDTGTQILSPEAFFLTLDMLGRQATPNKNVLFAKKDSPLVRHYWKTGTSSSFRDAWTAGIFGDYVLIVWVGNFDGTPNNAFSGAKTAAPIYFALADEVIKYDAAHGKPVKNNNFLRDDLNISQIPMCDGVGGIAGEHCPHAVNAYFIPGKSPIETSSIYRAVAIDNKTGLRACTRNPDTTHMAVFEFWDAEYLDMFKRAGIKRNTPPNFMPDCNLDEIAATHDAPKIISPADGTRLVIVTDTNTEQVSFQAISDVSDANIFWFLDDNMIGITKSGDMITAPVAIGVHHVRAVDEIGAGTVSEFMVVK